MSGQQLGWKRYLVYLFFFVFSLLIGVTGYHLYQRHVDELLKHATDELTAIARLKAHQVSLWHENLLNQGGAIQNIPDVSRLIENYLRRGPDAPADQVMLNWLSSLQQYQGFYRICLMDAKAQPRLSLPSDYQPSSELHIQNQLVEARRTHGSVLSDIHRANNVHQNLLIPFFANGRPDGEIVGFLFIWIDPGQFLFPFLQDWPAESASAETVLFRREGNAVVCLNELRHRKDAPLNLRIPMSQTTRPSVQAILGKKGLLRGIDYREVPVLGFIEPVAGTSWYILTKMDEAEFDASIQAYGWLIASRMGAVFFSFVLGLGLLWQQKEAQFLRRQLEAEQQRKALEKHYAWLAQHANDIILLADETGRMLSVNNRASRAYGYAAVELCGMNVSDLELPETHATPDFNLLQERGEDGLIYETEHRRKDGSRFTVEVSARALTIEDKTYHQAIIRDITERKQVEKDLREQFELLQTLIETSANPISYKDTQGRLFWCNTAFEQFIGKSRQEIIGQTFYSWESKELADKILCAELELLNHGGRLTAEYSFTRPGERERHVIASKAVTSDATGRPTGIVTVLTDITERRQAEQALAQSEARYRHLLGALPLSVYTCDREGRLTFYNEQAAALWGRRPQLGEDHWWTPLRLCHADGVPLRPEEFPLLATLREGGRVASREVIVERHDGSRVHVLPHPEPLRNAAGEIIGAINVLTDITAIRLMEDSLRLSEEKYRKYVDDSPIAILVADGQGRYVDANPAACQMTGYSRDELLRRTIADLHAPGFMEDGPGSFVQLKKTDRLSAELHLLRKDGTDIYVTLEASRLSDDRFIGFFRNDTERVLAEVARREAERHYRGMLENVQIAAVMLDKRGKITFCNEFTLKLTGWTRDEVLGRDLFEVFIPPELCEEYRAGYRAQFSIGNIESHGEHEIATRSGERRLIAWDSTFLLDPQGNPVGIACLGRDITAQRQLEAQVRQSQKMEAIGQLAGGIAHDFNNLLQVMTGYVKLTLMDKVLQPDHREDLEQVMMACERAVTLVRQLLTFSRRQSGNPRPVNLNQTLDSLVKILKRMIGEHIEMRLDLQADVDSIQADPGQVEQVIMNLCINARDAMPQGGRIVIQTRTVALDELFCRNHSWARPGHYVRLAIRDTGCGIPEGIREHIFEPFFTTKEPDKGTGLGLATVYGIVQQHQGLISLASRVGGGTTFELYFPAIPAPAGWAPAVVEPPLVSGHETILLAEDDESLRTLVARILQDAGYQVLAAADGEEAARLIDQHLPGIDLAVLDVVMPKMNGRQVHERIRARNAQTPVIFSSGYNLNLLDSSFVPQEEFVILQKPYTFHELLRRVREVLDGKRKS